MSEKKEYAKKYLAEHVTEAKKVEFKARIKSLIIEKDGQEFEFSVIGLQKAIIEFYPGLDPIVVTSDDGQDKIISYLRLPEEDKTKVVIECVRLLSLKVGGLTF